MPAETATRLHDGDHVVQFYAHDQDLIAVVARYLGGALADGDAVVVIASRDHRAGFLRALATMGHDTAALEDTGRLTVRDASEVLRRLSPGGLIDQGRFDEVVGSEVAEAARHGRGVRAYGEMVALMWEDGDLAGALALEEMWNDLSARVPFSLFCAYPEQLMTACPDTKGFAEVCHLHSTVVTTAPSEPATDARGFARSLHEIASARYFVASVLKDWRLGHLIDDASLVTSELAANALTHAGSDFTVAVTVAQGRVRPGVGDSSSALPVERPPEPGRPGGRGLRIVDSLGHGWGSHAVPGGKIVWVEFAHTEEDPSRT